MAASVAGPIERQLSTIAGITSMTSTSSLGLTQITIQFDLNRNIDGAALDVQTALTVAQRRLPIEMTTPPFFRKVNPGDFPILFISLVSSTLPLSTVDDYGEITLAQQISQLPGIAQVLVYGAQKFAVRVQVDPVAAAARSISLDDIRTVVCQDQLQHAGRHHLRPAAERDACCDRRACATPPNTAMSSSPIATARRSSSTKSRRSSTASRTTRSRAVQQRARDRAGDPAPAGRQHGRGRRFGPRAAADLPRPDAGGGQDGDARRPLGVDPRRRSTTCR